MIYRIKVLILLFVIPTLTFSQNKVITKEYLNTDKEIPAVLTKIEDMKFLNDSIIAENKKLKDQLYIIISSNKASLNKLNENEIFFNRVNLSFTIIATILGVFTILSPIIILTTSILPARKEIKNLKSSVHDFIVTKERESIEFAINKLFSDLDKDKYEAAFLLSNRIDFKYSHDDIKKIIDAHDQVVDSQTKFLIRSILSNQATLETDKFFREIVKKSDLTYNLYHVIRYLSTSKSDFTSELLISLEKTENCWIIFNSLITQSINSSFSLALEFVNNDLLINFLEKKITLENFKFIENQILTTAKIYNPELISNFEDCALLKKIRDLEKVKESLEVEKDVEKKEESEYVSDLDILEKNGIKNVNGQFVDAQGKIYEHKEVVQTMMGPQEVKKMINVNGRYIDIKTIS